MCLDLHTCHSRVLCFRVLIYTVLTSYINRCSAQVRLLYVWRLGRFAKWIWLCFRAWADDSPEIFVEESQVQAAYVGSCNCSFRHLWLSDTLSWMIYSKAGGLWFILCYLCYSQVCYTGHINAHSGRSVLFCRLPVQSQWYLVDMIEVLVCCDDSKPMCEHQWGLASYLTLHSSTFIMIYLYTWTR